jgi:RHS repeat-associated protein
VIVLAIGVIPSFAGNKVFFYHTDAAGTPVAMSDASGEVVWRADYMPFGEEHEITGNVKNKNRFIGKEKDEETDLYYFGARYLDASTGRFIKPDPVGIREADLLNPQRLNRYSYSLNNPYRYVDPDGREVVLRPEAMQTFYKARQQILGWAPSIVQEIIMPDDPIIGPAAVEVGKGKVIGNALDVAKTSKRGTQIPTVRNAAKQGQQAHKDFADKVKQKPGWQSEPSLIDPATGKTVKPDAVTPSGRPVELKPNTTSGRSKGAIQIKKYERATGKTGRVVYY